MFLKRLDVVGFKSFADRIAVDFVPGVTAVVGPNGSGKSNITDAIRWVLGEQSAKSLRGSKMEDVIFSGSDSRKAVNFAEVTLTLENDDQFLPLDYHEVSVTRRVYRSGESEYLINKQSCRLKDIIELFMDSGLGREAFSIISQGKVEEILNSKAEDRRSIFEEAAGVLKYKTRKKKAEGKLVETQENLNRVNDILHELEGQVEPLKIQSSMAKEYLDHKENLEQIEVALMVHDIEEAHQKFEAISAQLEGYKEKELQLLSMLQSKEAKMEEWKNDVSALDESINDLQQVLLLVSEELEKLEGRKEVLKERKKNAAQNRGQLEKSKAELEEKVSLLKQQKEEHLLSVTQLKSEATRIEEELKVNEKKMQLYNVNLEEKIESLKSDYIELLNEQAASKNESSYITQQLESQTRKTSLLDEDNAKFTSERARIVAEKARITARLAELEAELANSAAGYEQKQLAVDEMKAKVQKIEKSLYQSYQFIQQAKSRKEMLEELEDDYAGFFQGVKEVLKARDKALTGIHGAVAELMNVPKEYNVSIEIALGGSMQHLVVEAEQHARQAIAYLKKNGYGRATFLPMSIIKGKKLSESQLRLVQGHSSFIGVAADLIAYDSKYQDIMGNLLGNVIITKDLKGANEMAKALQYRSRFVTLEGEIVNPGGSMTGGAIKQKSASILTRKGELEDLKTKIFEMEKTSLKLEDQLKKGKNTTQEESAALEELRLKQEDIRFSIQSIKDEQREIEFEERTMNEKLSQYDRNKADYLDEQQALKDRKMLLNEKLGEFVQNIQALEQEIAQLTEQKNQQSQSREQVAESIGELRVAFAAKKEQLSNATEKLATVTSDLEESEAKWQLVKEDLELLTSEMTDSHSGEEHLEDAAEKKQQEKAAAIQLIGERRAERLQLQMQLDELDLDVKETRRIHRGMVQALKDEEVKLNRIDVELDSRLTNLREEYMMTFEGAKEEYPLTMELEDARKKVKLIKLAMEELGTVNLGAIEEYERISERYDFLLEQKTDLEEAKDTLYQVIDEMDDEMKKRFQQTFEGIQGHFEGVFQRLFGGGHAALRLTNPDDLLNTGVEIVAQPPGKKLQNLSLLSGGERALTAIALLFAILKVRPVPFCILDEVEAALDEANVFRFSSYLKSYSSETQFIVITHRKGTMEEADVLYGVTMQESGVSKLVSVRLSETSELVAT
ncbi:MULTISPECIES: chromosome segregation protein SMC [unclassified Niallia]|uniref:chromosome segregation protein SMC n=1 Tax=unclassified Niallia TaxID=2837522 RepID=UPI001EDC2886|nr:MULTISPECIES: chromosome segregation protein SMC [unclassified Niallia]MDL0435096.1 chromosome segregation protein SMC [Niallia sp. SS-2023]UPO88897.1 chromosome segregation protein SMC [Niallia sp. Man26]